MAQMEGCGVHRGQMEEEADTLVMLTGVVPTFRVRVSTALHQRPMQPADPMRVTAGEYCSVAFMEKLSITAVAMMLCWLPTCSNAPVKLACCKAFAAVRWQWCCALHGIGQLGCALHGLGMVITVCCCQQTSQARGDTQVLP